MRQHLILFMRQPRFGVGKRRLAGAIGDAAALRFERVMRERLLRRLGNDRRWRLTLAITPDRARRERRALPVRIASSGQGGGDLGVRMHRAMRRCKSGPVVLVGADIPALSAAYVAAAFRLLGRHDLVFGPAADGGFWLVGARRRPAPLPQFGRVRWSSPHALADVLAAVPRHLSVSFAATLADVDDAASWRRLAPIRGF